MGLLLQIISGLQNFNSDSVASVVTAAEQVQGEIFCIFFFGKTIDAKSALSQDVHVKAFRFSFRKVLFYYCETINNLHRK